MRSPPSPAAVFDASMRTALSRIERNVRGMLRSRDPEYLHQLRVGLRRLRSLLRAFRAVLPDGPRRRIARALRKLSPALGEARDWDVLAPRLEHSGAPAEAIERAHARRKVARRRAVRALRSARFRKALTRARALSVESGGKSAPRLAEKALTREHRRLMKRARGIDWRDEARRHAMRIRVKRLRYACDAFAPAFPGSAAAGYVGALKGLQAILGELNDIATGRRLAGLEADEGPLLRKLAPAWARFAKRRPFWRARG